MRITVRADSAADTRAAGEALASLLQPTDVVALGGGLGAGKTTFVQGGAKGLGVMEPVVSPTFTLIREYKGRLPVYHVDVYRLERIQDVIDIGFEELADADGVVFVEWGDAIEPLLPDRALHVRLAVDRESDTRTIELESASAAWASRWERLESALEGVGAGDS